MSVHLRQRVVPGIHFFEGKTQLNPMRHGIIGTGRNEVYHFPSPGRISVMGVNFQKRQRVENTLENVRTCTAYMLL